MGQLVPSFKNRARFYAADMIDGEATINNKNVEFYMVNAGSQYRYE